MRLLWIGINFNEEIRNELISKLDLGVISEEEYNKQRNEIISNL